MSKSTYLLLEQRDQEVDGQHDVLDNLVLLHVDVSDGDTETKNLLKLELDGGSDFVDLSGKVLGVGDRGREFTGLGKTGTEETGYE
jgi:hypothetical protein